jgi:hypothetical protein
MAAFTRANVVARDGIECHYAFTICVMVVVEAVPSEPLSRPDSLLSGINTGIFFMGFAENALAYLSILMNPGDFSRLPLDCAPAEQGI